MRRCCVSSGCFLALISHNHQPSCFADASEHLVQGRPLRQQQRHEGRSAPKGQRQRRRWPPDWQQRKRGPQQEQPRWRRPDRQQRKRASPQEQRRLHRFRHRRGGVQADAGTLNPFGPSPRMHSSGSPGLLQRFCAARHVSPASIPASPAASLYLAVAACSAGLDRQYLSPSVHRAAPSTFSTGSPDQAVSTSELPCRPAGVAALVTLTRS